MSDSLGLVDFAIGLVNSVLNLPDGQVKFFEEFKLQKNCEINLLIKTFLGLVEMTFGLVNASFSLPEWQAVKIIFFAPRVSLYIFCKANKKITSKKTFLGIQQVHNKEIYFCSHFFHRIKFHSFTARQIFITH